MTERAVSTRFAAAVAAIDAQNSADPNVEEADGRRWPRELLYSRRMTAWLERLVPDASEALRLAARAQHIRRWEIPRDSFPLGRKGYLQWRTHLYGFHADRAAEVLRQVGYDEETVGRVRSLVGKRHLRTDPEMQALEDVICVVFLESYFAEFTSRYAARLDEEKVVHIVRKTWRKMTPRGHRAALDLVEQMPEGARRLVEAALAE